MHTLLRRQIKKFFGDVGNVPPECAAFLRAIEQAYQQYDDDHEMIERSLDLSSRELLQANSDLRASVHAQRQRTEQIVRQHAALHELAILTPGDLAESIARITEVAASMLDVTRSGVWFFDERRTRMRCECLRHEGVVTRRPGIEVAASDFPRYFEAIGETLTLAVSDARNDPRTSEFRESYLEPVGIRSVLDVLVRVNGAVIGVLSLGSSTSREWTLEEQDFAASVAGLVSLAVVTEERFGLEDRLRQVQKMEAIGVLAGGVAHDFNNLLTAILGYCELVNFGVADRVEVQEHVHEIKNAAERAASLTRQLLAFSRKQVMNPKTLDLDALVNGVSRMLQRVIGEHIHVIIRSRREHTFVNADPSQLEQVLLNLAVNARDAMPSGGRLTIETNAVVLADSGPSRPHELAPGAYVTLTVSDTGTGIDQATLPRIFEPFFTTKRIGEGTGLGLATVYGIVQQSGGHIAVSSIVGRGTTFEIYLPAAPGPDASTLSTDVIGGAPTGSGEVILVCEDEPMVRALTVQFLRHLKYTVLGASHPGEALALCESHSGRIDLLLTDVLMPEMNGRELYRFLSRTRRDTAVLYMSGYTESGIVQGGVLEADTAFLPKPFTLVQLAHAVRNVLPRVS
jgi:signal transduction histidine kinase/CheY-like chemotaxis protein